MHQVLVIDNLRSDYLGELETERDALEGVAEVQLCRVSDERGIDDRLERADAVIVWHAIALGAATFRRMLRCRGVVRSAVGFDNIDIETARVLGIPVANVPDYGTEEVADHTMALLLACQRNLLGTHAAVQNGVWDWRTVGPLQRLRGQRLGLLGFGRIGMAVAQRAKAFGLDCRFYDPHLVPGIEKSLGVGRAASLPDLLGDCDVLSIHTPSSPATRGLVGRAELELLAPQATLINTARGDVIDQQALLEHLRRHPGFRAGLDVLAAEPSVPAALRGLPNVVLTGHSAFYSKAALHEMRHKSAATVRQLLLGETVPTIINGVARRATPAPVGAQLALP
jgi:lactate dehydrogenase-like 2-hydroxyacid dehydrogenase